ncbi:Nif11-like leader peptide family natural product precursor [Hydrocoleum sp. CS-953]|uniref:Nif11-like leader peptide family natural product precursor n=1 Tax=Hydrocoleum sp. CS-953 TaxID=1671698 RepID=UPI000B9B96F2|nr:Nif11-like leader peptide family natural product precursor [Hydrocoleum sp. CS-953]
MSLENVQAFYERIADDQEFLAQLQATQTQEEGKKILEEAGYEFSTEELEEYTSQMLESTDGENNVFEEMNEEQLAAVVGGLSTISFVGGLSRISFNLSDLDLDFLRGITVQPAYGVAWRPPTAEPTVFSSITFGTNVETKKGITGFDTFINNNSFQI